MELMDSYWYIFYYFKLMIDGKIDGGLVARILLTSSFDGIMDDLFGTEFRNESN